MNEAHADLAELVNRAAYSGTRVVLERRGKAIAAIVPLRDLEQLEADSPTINGNGAS